MAIPTIPLPGPLRLSVAFGGLVDATTKFGVRSEQYKSAENALNALENELGLDTQEKREIAYKEAFALNKERLEMEERLPRSAGENLG